MYGTNGQKLHSIIFYYLFKTIQDRGGGIKQFKVFQKSLDNILIQIVKNKKFNEECIRFLDEKIKAYLGNDTSVKFEYLTTIKREQSGKLVDFVSEL